jgi:ribonuclease BN (tRNA processing enzyme)
VRLTVLGGCGAWPQAGHACSGFLVEHDGFRLLLDLGYATLPRLLELVDAAAIDAVYVTHGHPDHCADLNPLLRARSLAAVPAPPLPVYALPHALDAVLALDRPGMLDGAVDVRTFAAGDALSIGPFTAATAPLPHYVPNAGVRLTADHSTLVYTGDTGPGPEVVALAAQADLLIADATYVDEVPEHAAGNLSSAVDAGRQATEAGVRSLLLTHLWPGTDPYAARAAARRMYAGGIGVAETGLAFQLA